jgi:drug/metabolite transporter superfamily protein YnfA
MVSARVLAAIGGLHISISITYVKRRLPKVPQCRYMLGRNICEVQYVDSTTFPHPSL